MTVKTIADYMLNIIPWFYRLGGSRKTTSCMSWSRLWNNVTGASKPWPTPRPDHQKWAPS
jgi:hypothetical protein